MSKPTHEPAAPRRLSFAQKLALAGGAGVAITGLTAQSADATPIRSTTLPLSPPATNGSTFWDVDGDGTEDFRLRHLGSFAYLTELGAARLVAPDSRTIEDGFARLNAGFNVVGTMSGFKFFASAQNYITITGFGNIGADASEQGWFVGDIGFFGFKFTKESASTTAGDRSTSTGLPEFSSPARASRSPRPTTIASLMRRSPSVTGALPSPGSIPPRPGACSRW